MKNSLSFIEINENRWVKKIHLTEKCYKQNMEITFRENIFVLEDFLPTVIKRCIENKRVLGDTARKLFTPFNFKEIENFKILLHLVNI